MKGQGGGGTAKGGGKSRSGGESITITTSKQRQTQAINDTILSLRSAIFTPSGSDKNVLESISSIFLTYQRNGLDLTISLQFSLSKDDLKWYSELIKEHMEEKYDMSGLGWDDDDKRMELNEDGKRFLVIRERVTGESSKGKGKLVGIVHFRFTVQGEVLDIMAGESTLHVSDIHLIESVQRKGLGKHLLTILELVARKEGMSLLSIPVPLGDETTIQWLNKCKGYTPDTTLPLLGFNSEEEGFEVYMKRLLQPIKSLSTLQASPVSITSSPQMNENENVDINRLMKNLDKLSFKSVKDLSEDAFNVKENVDSTVFENAHRDEDRDHEMKDNDDDNNDDDDLDLSSVDEKDIITQLEIVFEEKNGRKPTEEEMNQWLVTLREVTAESHTEDIKASV